MTVVEPGIELVDQIGPNTLILRGGLLDVVSNVPPESVGRSDVYLSTIVEATLVIEVLDEESGTLLAMVSERRRIASPVPHRNSVRRSTRR